MPSISTGHYQESEPRAVGRANASVWWVAQGIRLGPRARQRGRDRVPAVRCRRVLLAGLFASGAAAAPAWADPPQDLRDTFGLSQPPAARADCGDGLAFDCAIATDPFDGATPYALSTWLPVSWLGRLPAGAATHD